MAKYEWFRLVPEYPYVQYVTDKWYRKHRNTKAVMSDMWFKKVVS